jgi:sulfur carrier protein
MKGYTTAGVVSSWTFLFFRREKMQVNGEKIVLTEQISLAKFLQQRQYRAERVVVELNGTIAPKASYDEIILQDADVLEIVSFVGGG